MKLIWLTGLGCLALLAPATTGVAAPFSTPAAAMTLAAPLGKAMPVQLRRGDDDDDDDYRRPRYREQYRYRGRYDQDGGRYDREQYRSRNYRGRSGGSDDDED